MRSTLGSKGLRVSALATAIFACGFAAPLHAADETWAQAPKSIAAIERAAGRDLYIVGLKSAPVATYAGGRAALPAIPRTANGRLDVQSAAALAYVDALRGEQASFLQGIGSRFGRSIAPIAPHFQFFHAFNGMVLSLTEEEAARLVDDPMVAMVEGYKEFALSTDAGPALIGAPTVWAGSSTPNALATRGEGVVVGIIDSGANLGSPSFAATDVDGYTHVNPLGGTTYLGWCDPANPNHNPARDVCNSKLIGGWDFTDTAFPAGQFEASGFEDENGHGSHTASTAAGNRRTGTIAGVTSGISGVAPRANLVIYDACYTTTTGNGLCPNVSTLGSINRVVADGIIDVVNYSISGSQSPWTDANAQAFLAAHNAGVFVAASAGNGTPTPGTTNHIAPWVTTVAASTHDRAFFGNTFNFAAPAAPPTAATNVPLQPGANPPFISASITAAPLIESPTFGTGNPNNDGCVAFPAGAFTRGGNGGIALIRWGSATSACGTIARVNAAATAGAIGVIFLADVPLNAGAGGTVPAWVINDTTRAAAIRTHLATDPANATATIAFPGQGFPGQPDVMASFSLIGPSNFDLLKPDITGPGVNILAAVSRWTLAAPPGSVNVANNNAVGLISGTSMSSPHIAGSAALLRALNRSWTPSQIKSALVSTARTQNVFKFSATSPASTPSDPFDRGGGRVDLTRAARAGLLMDETGANFTAANPASGGNPAALNLPSIQSRACVGNCTFTRTVRSTRNPATTWTASIAGLPAGVATVSPGTFTLSNAATQSITVSIDSTQISASAFAFAELVLTPNTTAVVEQRFPIAVRAAPPRMTLSQPAITATAPSGTSATAPLTVANAGNPTINWSYSATGTGPIPITVQTFDNNWGNSTNFYSGQTPTAGGIYTSDDFTPMMDGALNAIRAEGFMLGTGGTLPATATAVTFKVYSDAANLPAGNPEAGAAGEIYSCVRTPTGPNSGGLAFSGANGANFSLDVAAAAAAGCPAAPSLTGGTRYWVVAYPTVPGNTAGRRWLAGRATVEQGQGSVIISPLALSGVPNVWTPTGQINQPPNPIGLASFAYSVTGAFACGAPWLSIAPTSGALGVAGSTATTVTLNAASLAPGVYRTALCVSSNGSDPANPQLVIPVTLTVTPPLTDDVFANGFEPAPMR